MTKAAMTAMISQESRLSFCLRATAAPTRQALNLRSPAQLIVTEHTVRARLRRSGDLRTSVAGEEHEHHGEHDRACRLV